MEIVRTRVYQRKARKLLSAVEMRAAEDEIIAAPDKWPVVSHTAEHDLVQAAREMAAHRRGELSLPTRKVTPPDAVDVAALRKKIGDNQRQFANHFGFALSAVKEWEQGRRKPERSARILLAVIATNPQAIEQALTVLSP